MNKKVRILVIDSGIDNRISELEEKIIIMKSYRVNTEGNIYEVNDLIPTHAHGSVISSIIQWVCDPVEFISFNILDKELCADSRLLVYALNQALLYNADIVHLSLGTTNKNHKRDICSAIEKLVNSNTIIVSAAENTGKTSYPAFLDNVIGVKGYYDGNTSESLIYQKDQFLFAPANKHSKIKEIEGIDYDDYVGNSIAAGYVTGFVARLMLDQPHLSKRDVMRYVNSPISLNI